ncbi:thiosulfate sulfurtransferase 18-like [Actinidia eriantha]|uniref:thiosulfate sulfurtransferase 18-like n=1 Tax=Actinidia eriantha TaxID=165200 RepID=UPI00258F9756|nr:thiosulfate sulfurtransferase 18-like [Actinidia eriantha]
MDSKPSLPVEVITVDVHAAKELIRSGHRYLDVRTAEEFKKGHVHVENALNIPYMFNTPRGRVKNPEFMEQVLSVFKKEDPLVIGCQSGVRSVYATTDLLTAGFKHVLNMGGGYAAWVENGLGVTKPEEQVAL